MDELASFLSRKHHIHLKQAERQNNIGKSAFKRSESVPRREQQGDAAQYNNDGDQPAAREMQRKDGYTFRVKSEQERNPGELFSTTSCTHILTCKCSASTFKSGFVDP